MPRLINYDRNQAIGMFLTGSSKNAIARRFGCSHSTIVRLVDRYQQTGAVQDRPRPGRPRVTTPRQDLHLRVAHLRDRFLPASATARRTIGVHGRRIHPNTVRSRLRAAGLKARRPHRAQRLTARHRRDRLRWARAHIRLTRQQWSHVLFSDESRIQLNRADGRKRVWRRRNERYADACTMEVNRWGGGSIHFWAGISEHLRTPLVIFDRNVNANLYIDDVLRPVVVPFFHQNFPRGNGILQQDGARPHTANVTRNFLQQNGISVLNWPALSPDMSPIEHVWDMLKRRVYQRAYPPENVAQLRQALVEEWDNIPQRCIANTVLSMRRRCRDLLAVRGGYTRY